jgi:hypothetical protein
LPDPEVADCGPGGCDIGLPENDYSPLVDPFPPASETVSSSWARGDAIISSIDLTAGGAASNIGEVAAQDGVIVPASEPVSAEATNRLDGTLTVAADGTPISFSFDSATFLAVWSTDESPAVATVSADLEFNISVSQGGVRFFNWAPTGAGAAFGGTVLSEPFSLNAGESTVNGNNNVKFVDSGNFEATTTLDAGTYSISITMKESAEGSQTAVPVPAPLALLGAGLAAISFTRRRKLVS